MRRDGLQGWRGRFSLLALAAFLSVAVCPLFGQASGLKPPAGVVSGASQATAAAWSIQGESSGGSRLLGKRHADSGAISGPGHGWRSASPVGARVGAWLSVLASSRGRIAGAHVAAHRGRGPPGAPSVLSPA